MATSTTFLKAINLVLANYDDIDIKLTIGDSTTNNRVPSVRQIIRFLNEIGEVELSNQLNAVYSNLRGVLHNNRDISNFRTDSFDFNEFVLAYETAVLNGTSQIKRSITSILNSNSFTAA